MNRVKLLTTILLILFASNIARSQYLEFHAGLSQGFMAPAQYDGSFDFGYATHIEAGVFIEDNFAVRLGYSYNYLLGSYQIFNQFYVSGSYRVFLDSEVSPFVSLGAGTNFNFFPGGDPTRLAVLGEFGIEVARYTLSMRINYANPYFVQGLSLGYIYSFDDYF